MAVEMAAAQESHVQHVLDRFSDAEWTLRADRCVAEFAARFAGVTILPGWFPASSGRLTLDDGLRLVLDATKPATDPKPLARRIRSKLNVARFREIEFSSTFVTRAGRDRLVMVGELSVAGRKTVIALQARVVSVSERAVILHGESYLPLAEVLPGRKQVKRGWRHHPRSLRLTLAAEFRHVDAQTPANANKEDE